MNELFRRTQQILIMDRFQQSVADAGCHVPGYAVDGYVSFTSTGYWYFNYLSRDFVQNDDQISRISGMISVDEARALLKQGIPLVQELDTSESK